VSAPLLTGRCSLPVLKGVNPICFGQFSSKPFTQPNIPLANPKSHEFARTAIHWNIFSSSIEKRKPDLLKP
jgi:hypothetical protein